MAARVGIDLVSEQDVRESIDAHGARYLERVFSPRELAECRADDPGPGHLAARLAARLAAKEATFKVLRVGKSDPTVWREVEVCGDPAGQVRLSLTGSAANLAESEGIGSLAVSLTHGRGSAVAVVIAGVLASDR